MKIIVFFLLICIGPIVIVEENYAQDKGDGAIDKLVDKAELPVPKEEKQLFYLQRDPNTNTVIYTLNMEDGKIDENQPVKAHWIRYAEGGKRTGLSFIQRKFAYGVHHTKTGDQSFDIRLQAYKDLEISIRFNSKKDKYQAYTAIDDKEIVLERIFVRIDGGSYFKPDVRYIEVLGYDPITKSKVSQRFSPK